MSDLLLSNIKRENLEIPSQSGIQTGNGEKKSSNLCSCDTCQIHVKQWNIKDNESLSDMFFGFFEQET